MTEIWGFKKFQSDAHLSHRLSAAKIRHIVNGQFKKRNGRLPHMCHINVRIISRLLGHHAVTPRGHHRSQDTFQYLRIQRCAEMKAGSYLKATRGLLENKVYA